MKTRSLLLSVCLATTSCITHTASRLSIKAPRLLHPSTVRMYHSTHPRCFASSSDTSYEPLTLQQSVTFIFSSQQKAIESALQLYTDNIILSRKKLWAAEQHLHTANADYQVALKEFNEHQNKMASYLSKAAEEYPKLVLQQKESIIQVSKELKKDK